MSETPPPPFGADPDQPPPTTPYPSSPYQQPQPPYGAPPPYSPMYAQVAREHPQSTTVLVLGILSLVLCQVIAPFAWVMGNRVVDEIEASRGQIGGHGAAQAGRICGIIGTVILGLYVVGFGVVIIAAVASSSAGY